MSQSNSWSEESTPNRFYLGMKYAVRALSGGEPLTGLYIAFRVLPPAGSGSPTDRVVELAYAAPDESEEERTARERAEKEFSLAFVDPDGFLQPVTDVNPWYEIHAALQAKAEAQARHEKQWNAKKQNRGVPPPPLPPVNRNPDSIKLSLGTRMRACLIRHPSAHLARALCDWLRGGEDPHEYGFSRWGTPETLLRTLETKQDTAVDALNLDGLSSEPADYFPLGPKRYGGWTLYVDMPHASLPSVQEAVGRLKDDLGRLRYPVGGNTPYGGWKLKDGARIASANRGTFDLVCASAVTAFQYDASGPWAFKLADKALAYALALDPSPDGDRKKPKNSWAYLIGSTVKRAPVLNERSYDQGVVDVASSAAIRAWLEEGLRKPGVVLLELPATDEKAMGPQWVDWARPELAFAFELWREFSRALGCEYGLSFTHVFRNAEAAGGVGRAECSIHKTGNAVDLAVKGSLVGGNDNVVDFSLPAAHFPIRFEASWNWDARSAIGRLERELDGARKKLEAARKDASKALRSRLTNTRRDIADASAKQAEAASRKVKVPRFKDDLRPGRTQVWLDAAGLQSHLEMCQTRLAHLERISTALETRALDAGAAPGEPELPEVVKVRAAEARLKVAQEQFDRAHQTDTSVRSAYRISWRLYGHSIFNPFRYQADPARLLQEVENRLGAPSVELRADPTSLWGIEARFRQALHSYVPTPNNLKFGAITTGEVFLGPMEVHSLPSATLSVADELWGGPMLPECVDPVPDTEQLARLETASWEELVDAAFATRPELKRCREVAQMLVDMGGEGLLRTLFRLNVTQFVYNPFEADGGHDGSKVDASADVKDGKLDYFDQTEVLSRAGIPDKACSFLNLTALGFLCGLLRIGANRGGWRDPRTDPGAKVKAPFQKVRVDGHLGPLAGIIERMGAEGTDGDDDFFFVTSKEGRVAHWVRSVDRSFLLMWARTLKKASEDKARKKKLSGPAAIYPEPAGRFISSRMVCSLSMLQGEQEQVRTLLSTFASKRFKVVHVGHSVEGIKVADVVEGQTVLTQFETALAKFISTIEAREEEVQKEKEARKVGKKVLRPVKPLKSVPRLRDDWTFVLQPYFDLDSPPPGAERVLTPKLLEDNEAKTGALIFNPGDSLEVPTPGIGRALEWWHYETEHANRTPWGQLLTEIGYGYPVLAAPALPLRDILPRRYFSRGMDFAEGDELGKIKGGGVIGFMPENTSLKAEPPERAKSVARLPPLAEGAGN